jgi:hypothetical protein
MLRGHVMATNRDLNTREAALLDCASTVIVLHTIQCDKCLNASTPKICYNHAAALAAGTAFWGLPLVSTAVNLWSGFRHDDDGLKMNAEGRQ